MLELAFFVSRTRKQVQKREKEGFSLEMLVDPYLSMCVCILYLYNQIHVHEASICDITTVSSTIGNSMQTIIINYLGYS